MATTASYYGTNYTVADNQPGVASFLDANEWGGHVRVLTDTFTAGATDTGTAGSFIYIGKLPKGSVPLMTVMTSPATRTWTATVGWSGAASALGTFAAGVAGIGQVSNTPVSQAGTQLTENKDVYITTATDAIVSGDIVTTSIFYVNGA